MRFLLSLLLLTRVGGMGLTVALPDGWRTAAPGEVRSQPGFARVAVILGDAKNKGASIRISRAVVPVEARGGSPVDVLEATGGTDGHEPRLMKLAGMPAAELDLSKPNTSMRQVVAVRGEVFYLVTFGARSSDEDAAKVYDEVLKSFELNDEATRIEAGGISVDLPDGWTQVSAAEREALSPNLEPQNELQQRIVDEHITPRPLLAMTREVAAGSNVMATVQIAQKAMLPEIKSTTSMGVARFVADATNMTFGGKLEVAPREVTVSGMPGAEFITRYKLVEEGGSHQMRAHMVIVSRETYFYVLAYAGLADDKADAETFRKVVKSVKFAEK